MTSNIDRERNWLLKDKYSGRECPEYLDDLRRLEAGEPLAYIIGWVDFLSCRIDLSFRPLIPRTETEWWVGSVLDRKRTTLDKNVTILDLFSGSGCIGIAIANMFPHLSVDCADIDPRSLEQIQKNATKNGVDNNVHIIQSDVFEHIPGRYDMIFANPPYIDSARAETVEDSVLKWEPQSALFAEDGGLFYVKRLIRDAAAHLHPAGILLTEFARGQERDIARLLDEHGWSFEIRDDQFGIPRWFEATIA